MSALSSGRALLPSGRALLPSGRTLPASAALAIIATCWIFRDLLEQDPVTHVLIQLPLLALAGAMLARTVVSQYRRPTSSWNAGGVPMLLLAIVTIAFWMLPRSIDAALVDDWVEFGKFITVPGLIGMPLLLGWRRAHPLLRGFLKAQALSMLGVMAFLYTHAPIRICNAYLVGDQERLGLGFLVAAIALAIIWTVPIFTGQREGGLVKSMLPISP